MAAKVTRTCRELARSLEVARPRSGAVAGDPGPSSLMGCNESHLDKGWGKDGGGVDSQEPSPRAGASFCPVPPAKDGPLGDWEFRLRMQMHCSPSYLKLPEVNYLLRQSWIPLRQSAISKSTQAHAGLREVTHSNLRSTLRAGFFPKHQPCALDDRSGAGLGSARRWPGCW